MKIAILGATGHVGRSLTAEYLNREIELDLYARQPSQISPQIVGGTLPCRARVQCKPLAELDFKGCSIVINALGLGAPEKVAAAGTDILRTTLEWEERIKAMLTAAPECLYVFISSGAVYGPLTSGAANETSTTSFLVNDVDAQTAYARAKFTAETWHRTWAHKRVLDVRLFGYVSTSIDLSAKYFFSEMAAALINRQTFHTGGHDMVRDYVSSQELADLVDGASQHADINTAVDIFSARPAGKFELIDALRPMGLDVVIKPLGETRGDATVIPTRLNYCTDYDAARRFGYEPRRTSVEIVTTVARELLERSRP
jgi:nucleoside-diphosphate-sugar epimerase